MYDTTTRVEMVKKRIRQRQREKQKHGIFGLSALCLLLFASLVGTIGAFTGSGYSATISMYGSILLHEDVGGYVLVGVVSFTAAVALTVLCIRYRKRDKNRSIRGRK